MHAIAIGARITAVITRCFSMISVYPMGYLS
jgi:hypothetical protein